MIVHGYGIASIGSPDLLFSNVVWGHIIRLIPEVNNVLGYSIATFTVLVAVSTTIMYTLCRLGLNYYTSALAIIFLMARPILFPQFTINSGLLMVGAIVLMHLYSQRKDAWLLVPACTLAYFSYLIRPLEFLFVLAVATPILPWKCILQRPTQIALLALIGAITASFLFDQNAYESEEWTKFNDLNSARIPITDNGAGPLLKNKPEILAKYDYSTNDIDLVKSWFFVEPNIANPTKLNAMLELLGPLPTQEGSLKKAWSGVIALAHPSFIASLCLAIFLAALQPSWRIAALWALCISAIFSTGLLGRPGILRVYAPLVCLLVIAPLLRMDHSRYLWRRTLTSIAILLATVSDLPAIIKESQNSTATSHRLRTELNGFPEHSVIIWGSTYPYVHAHPALAKTWEPAMKYTLNGLGVIVHAPYSVTSSDESIGEGMIKRLTENKGVQIMALDMYIEMLRKYCSEHVDSELETINTEMYGSMRLGTYRCLSKPSSDKTFRL